MVSYEVLFPSSVLLYPHHGEWAPIDLSLGGDVVRLSEPVPGQSTVCPPQQQSNIQFPVGHTIFRFKADVGSIEQSRLFETWERRIRPIATAALLWIRVTARQYWLGVSPAQRGRTSTCSVISPEGTRGFGSLRPPLFLNPLTEEAWRQIGAELRSGRIPRTTEQMFCDGLLSYQNANLPMTITVLGIVAELELSDLIRDLRSVGNGGPSHPRGGKSKRKSFEWKLREGPQLYGAHPFQGRRPGAVEDLLNLYHKRGDAVHAPTGELTVTRGEIGRYIFAVEDLLAWAKEERERAGCTTPKPTPIRIPHIIGA